MKLPARIQQNANDDPLEVLSIFENGLPVRLIATHRENFSTCHANDDIASIVERNRADRFDFLPVTEGDAASDRIIGIIEIAPFFDGAAIPRDRVRSRMEPLSEQNLIGADASILSFVRDADQHRLRMVVSGRRISGLVSLSDLQKLPVRAALFAIVTHLEMVMADAIRREFAGTAEWLARLSEARQTKLQHEISQSKTDDTFVDALLFTQFGDKVTIIHKSPLLAGSRSVFKDQLKDIQLLRDRLAHANDYATTPDDGRWVCQTVRSIDNWIGGFSAWP